jgi:protein SCO1/2
MMHTFRCFRRLALLVLACTALATTAPSAQAAGKYTRTVADYTMPDVTLIDQTGAKVKFRELIASDKTILVDFVFATCTTICPVLSAGFSNFQKKYEGDPSSYRLISITIDPENDTPEIMADYLKRYGARPGWLFLTGTRKDIDAVMHAFDAYVPDKMSHIPVTLLKAPGKAKWVRLFGLLGTADLLSEVKQLPKP